MAMTKYVIAVNNMFLEDGPNLRWTDNIQRAMKFDFMFLAVRFAVIDLNLTNFEVELV